MTWAKLRPSLQGSTATGERAATLNELTFFVRYLADYLANITSEKEESLQSLVDSLRRIGLSERNSTLQAYMELEKERKLQEAIAAQEPGTHPGSVLEEKHDVEGGVAHSSFGFNVSDMMPEKSPDLDANKVSEIFSGVKRASPPRKKPPPPPMNAGSIAQPSASSAQPDRKVEDLPTKGPGEIGVDPPLLVPRPPVAPRPAGLPPKPASIPDHILSALQGDAAMPNSTNPPAKI
eukprot:687846-Hanusia_phi.AAC.2